MSNSAVVFPGQGSLGSLFGRESSIPPDFIKHLETLEQSLDVNISVCLNMSDESQLRNDESSLLVFAVNSYCYRLYLEENDAPAALAGYSVGQWSALVAANAISLVDAAALVNERARIMSLAVESSPSGMIAVIGLKEQRVREVLQRFNKNGNFAEIANYNCLGQYSISASQSCINELHEAFAELNPKKNIRLPVAGGWHSELLKEASDVFRARLENICFNPLSVPVMDNTNGRFLPGTQEALKDQLAKHICMPVMWSDCVTTLINSGTDAFYEVGMDNILTKFGFFIDRTVRHQKYKPYRGSLA